MPSKELWNRDAGSPMYQRIMRVVDQMIIYSSDLFSWDKGIGGNLIGGPLGLLQSKIIRFRVNPQRVDIGRSKIRTIELTKNGFETFYWGENYVTISVSASTGWMRPLSLLRNTDDYRLSPAYMWLLAFEEFFKKAEREGVHLNMIWDMTCYKGHIIDFKYTRDAEHVWDIPFGFTFMAYPDKIYHLTSIVPGLTAGLGMLSSIYSSFDVESI